jgi:hypothetical protein
MESIEHSGLTGPGLPSRGLDGSFRNDVVEARDVGFKPSVVLSEFLQLLFENGITPSRKSKDSDLFGF